MSPIKQFFKALLATEEDVQNVVTLLIFVIGAAVNINHFFF